MERPPSHLFTLCGLLAFSFVPSSFAIEPQIKTARAAKHGEGLTPIQDISLEQKAAIAAQTSSFITQAIKPSAAVSFYVTAGNRSHTNLFRSIAQQTGESEYSIKSGEELIRYLKFTTQHKGSVSAVTFAGHGWSSPDPEGHGLPGRGRGTGLYVNPQVLNVNGGSKGGASLADIKLAIAKKEIMFTQPCFFQIHSCNISVAFGKELSKVTGCQVYLPLGKCSPDENDSMAWNSSAGNEPASKGPENGFVRVTTITETGGKKTTIAEPIGNQFGAYDYKSPLNFLLVPNELLTAPAK